MNETNPRLVDEEHLMKLLTRLKLTSLRENLDNLLDVASKEELSYRELVYLLCREELKHKDARRIRMGLSIAHFPCVRTFETFDWKAQPSLDRSCPATY
jgi:DNA replication protein DnaC